MSSFKNTSIPLSLLRKMKLSSKKFLLRRNFGGDEENRTPDPLLARQVLSQLSYTPTYPITIYLGGLKWTRTTDLTLIRRAL